MTAIKPNIVDTGLYTATETAELLEISNSSLRNYVNAGLIGYKKGYNGRRYYYGAAIVKLWNNLHKNR